MFVELPPEDYQPGDEHLCGLLRYSLYGTRDAAQNWEEELASTLSGLGLTRRSACPCVWRGLIKGEDIVATVHGDDITMCDDNRDRPWMADDDAIDSQALTGGDITRYRALVARICYMSQDRPDLKVDGLRRARDPKRGEGPGVSCRLNLHLDASATMCLVDMQNLWILEASKSGRFATKKVDTSVNPADMMTKPIPKARIE